MTIAENIKRLRETHGLTQQQMGDIAGVTDKAVSTWENGSNVPRMGVIQKLSDHFGIPKSAIIDEVQSSLYMVKNIIALPKMKKVPLVGTIACGTPTMAEQNIEEYVDMPGNINADFALRCDGDSMIGARIFEGDIVYIHQQPTIANGQIAAVLIDNEATLKRVYYREGESLMLVAENPAYRPLMFTGEEMSEVRIIGLAVYFTSAIRHTMTMK